MNGYKSFRIYEDDVVAIVDDYDDVAVFNKQDAIALAHAILNHFKEDTE